MGRLITLEQLQEFLGKTVKVNVHLLSHLGDYHDKVYVGDFNFASSCEELLDGRRVLRGLSGFPNHLGEENNRFTIYNQSVPSDTPKRLHFRNGEYEQALKLWDARSRNN